MTNRIKPFLTILFCTMCFRGMSENLRFNVLFDNPATESTYKPAQFQFERKDRLKESSLLPAALLTASFLYNDYYLDQAIIKQGSIESPSLGSADYIQYSPAAIMLAIKAAGVEGRSDWKRMLTADAISTAIMAAVVNATKYTVLRERPDGSSRNSFPSGHTATSFMCAQMLHREYGETISPWISVCGYGIAATTAVFRVAANRHWCSDILAGAAIGIFSTELGYWLTDRIYGDNRLRKPVIAPDTDELPEWKFGLFSDYSIASDVFTSQGYGNPNAKPACSIGVDATWMPWYIGATVRANVTQMKWTGPNDIILPDKGSVADIYTIGAGLDLAFPVIDRLSLNGQTIAGYSPASNNYSFLNPDNSPVEWQIQAGMHYYANLGLEFKTTDYSSVSVHGGLDYYDKVWRSFVMGARFNFTF